MSRPIMIGYRLDIAIKLFPGLKILWLKECENYVLFLSCQWKFWDAEVFFPVDWSVAIKCAASLPPIVAKCLTGGWKSVLTVFLHFLETQIQLLGKISCLKNKMYNEWKM